MVEIGARSRLSTRRAMSDRIELTRLVATSPARISAAWRASSRIHPHSAEKQAASKITGARLNVKEVKGGGRFAACGSQAVSGMDKVVTFGTDGGSAEGP
jgi:hypothetical protein